VANFNSPGQVVLSGHQKTLDFMKTHFNAQDYGASRAKLIPLAVSAPFHCSLMKPAAEKLKTQLDKVDWKSSLKFGVIHNLDAEINTNGTKLISLLYNQMTKPVLWTASIKNSGVTRFAEFGAGRVLAGLCKKIIPESATFNIDTTENLKTAMGSLS
jgi:[acyl-carrier-protein] S-malonyltransferase